VTSWTQAGSNGGPTAVVAASSADGQTWTPTVTLGSGINPTVGLNANGVAVAAWEILSGLNSAGVQAAVRQPGGSWGAPATVASAGMNPLVGVDAAGDAALVWPISTGSIQASTMRAGGTWSAPVTIGAGVQPSLAIDPAGTVVAVWSTRTHDIMSSAATIGGSWSAPANLGPGSAYKQTIRLSIGTDGEAVAEWVSSAGVLAATRATNGTWTGPTTIATGSVSAAGVTQDATGDAIALIVQSVYTASWSYSAYLARHSAGGAWSAPVLLTALPNGSAHIGGTPAGPVVVTYTGYALTSLPGQGSAPAIQVGSLPTSSTVLATAAAGHALALTSLGGQLSDATESVP
jgi:hypothetical protein